jgi:uncharacterized protein (DUF952 family)
MRAREAGRLFKICREEDWQAAQRAGALALSADDARDGYVHLSALDQVRRTAAKHFGGQAGLVLLEVDEARLPAGTLRWERARDAAAAFPHLYAPLLAAYVVRAEPLPLGPGGAHVFPEDLQ